VNGLKIINKIESQEENESMRKVKAGLNIHFYFYPPCRAGPSNIYPPENVYYPPENLKVK
jgi:hypothetical protein